jgi:hypothetical protein
MLRTLLDACFQILNGLCQRLFLPSEALVLHLCLLELCALQGQCSTAVVSLTAKSKFHFEISWHKLCA